VTYSCRIDGGKVMDTPEAIGERIREIRRQRGITQEGLAEAVGVSRSAVAQWETGRAGQVTGNLTRVADVLGVHVAVLLGANPRGAPPSKLTGDEMALVRLYREATPKDRQLLLRTARRLGKAKK
jgi:transcriptional regulator with XRE-family HTH domain